MRYLRFLVPMFLLCLAGGTARAQGIPAWELSGGYSYLRGNITASAQEPTIHLSGGTASVTENVNNWFGGRVEAGFFGGTESGRNISAQTITYGPVVSLRKIERITPFAHVQFGAIHASQGYLGISQSTFRFAMIPGGGVDFVLRDRVAIRAQGDYMITRFLSLTQNNIEGSVALVIYLGRK